MKCGRNILIFKAVSEEDVGCTKNNKDHFLEQLENLNLNVRLVHALDFKYRNLETLKQKLNKPENYSALVFGSPRCVSAVAKAVDELDIRWKNLQVFAVGETTGRVVHEKLGIRAEGMNSGHGSALAAEILQYNLSRPVLMPCGNLSRDTISRILQDNDVSTDAVQVYETINHPNLENNLRIALENFSVDVIIYFSPSGINATLPLLQEFSVPVKETKIVAIGPTTEKALKELGFTVSATASKPTPESLASAVSQILT